MYRFDLSAFVSEAGVPLSHGPVYYTTGAKALTPFVSPTQLEEGEKDSPGQAPLAPPGTAADLPPDETGTPSEPSEEVGSAEETSAETSAETENES